MKNLKHNLISLYVRIKLSIKKSISNDNASVLMERFKKEYRVIDSRIKIEKGTMAFHRTLIILGLAVHNSLQEWFQNQEEVQLAHNVAVEFC